MNVCCSFFCSSSYNRNHSNGKIESCHLILTIIGVQLTLNKVVFLPDNNSGTIFKKICLDGKLEFRIKFE